MAGILTLLLPPFEIIHAPFDILFSSQAWVFTFLRILLIGLELQVKYCDVIYLNVRLSGSPHGTTLHH